MNRTMIVAAVLLLPLARPAGAAVFNLPCPPDIDCSTIVDVADLVSVITSWGISDTPADVDGSGAVNVADLVAVITAWGPCLFEYNPPAANTEAEQIGLELLGPGGPLLLGQETYERVDRDLGLIRTAFPELAGQLHTPAWIPDHLIVGVIQSAPQYSYPCHNAYYQIVDEDLIFSFMGVDWLLLTLPGNVNAAALAAIYTEIWETQLAEPDYLIGGENFWRPTPMGAGVWSWEIDDGWNDCFDGCDCHRVYTIEVDAAGKVVLIDVVEFGAPWCEF